MKTIITRRATLTAFACLCLGIGNAVGQQKTFKELLVGTWALDSVYDESTQDGKKTNPWGPGVKGLAMWDGNGHYSWQMMSADRSKTASDNPRNPVGQAIAHFGTYTVDDAAKTLTNHVERCTFPQWDGSSGTLNIAFPTEDDLTITLQEPIKDPVLGPIIPHLYLKRVK